MPNYVVLQVVLKEKLIGTGSGNLSEQRSSTHRLPRDTVCTRSPLLLPEARDFWAVTAFRQPWCLKA